MKWISFLLAALMLFLSVVPCGDEMVADSCSAQDHFHAQSSHEHDAHSDFDDCSPFCVCQCCHTYVVFPIQAKEPASCISCNITKENYLYNPHTKSIIHSIWRPPQEA